jgi:hypothetical protein
MEMGKVRGDETNGLRVEELEKLFKENPTQHFLPKVCLFLDLKDI